MAARTTGAPRRSAAAGRDQTGFRNAADQTAGIRLYAGGPADHSGPDGDQWRRAARLDGERHASGRALEQAAAAVQLFQAALRAGDEPAAGCDPRRDRHLDGDDDGWRAGPVPGNARTLPPVAAQAADSDESRSGREPGGGGG